MSAANGHERLAALVDQPADAARHRLGTAQRRCGFEQDQHVEGGFAGGGQRIERVRERRLGTRLVGRQRGGTIDHPGAVRTGHGSDLRVIGAYGAHIDFGDRGRGLDGVGQQRLAREQADVLAGNPARSAARGNDRHNSLFRVHRASGIERPIVVDFAGRRNAAYALFDGDLGDEPQLVPRLGGGAIA